MFPKSIMYFAFKPDVTKLFSTSKIRHYVKTFTDNSIEIVTLQMLSNIFHTIKRGRL